MSWVSTGNARIDQLLMTVDKIVCGLVDTESSVVVGATPEQLHTNIHVEVSPEDFGKVIGREGKNAKAIRALVSAIGNKLGLPTCTLMVADPDPRRRGNRCSNAPDSTL